MPITNNVVSSNPTNGEVYSRQHYVIQFVSVTVTCGMSVGFFLGTAVSFTNITYRHDIAEILVNMWR